MKECFALQSAKIVGTPSGSCWSQTHCFSPEESDKKEKRGNLLAVLVIKGLKEGIEAVAAGREVLGRLHEEYYGNLEGSAFDRLGEAVNKVCLEQEGLEISAAAMVGEVVYLAIFGKGKILLKRGERLGVVLSGAGGLATASGLIKDNDLVVLGSEKFFTEINGDVLRTALKSNDLDQAVELLAPAILGKTEVSEVAVVLGLFSKKRQEAQSEEISPEEILPVTEEQIPEKRLGPFSMKRNIFVRSEDFAAKRRFYFLLSLVLLILLGFGFVFGIKKSYQNKKKTEVKALLSQAEEKLNQAKAVFVTDAGQGRLLAEEAKSIVLDLAEAEEIRKQIEDFLFSSQTEIVLSNIPAFMDLNLIADGAEGSSLSVIGKNLIILDSAKNKIYFLDFEKKSHKISDVLGGKDDLAVVVDGKVATLSGKDQGWGKIVGLASFGRNLYLLDQEKSDLWRYASSGDGFGAKKSWFVNTSPDLSKSVSLAIDGAVWILEKEKILKFNLGRPENFVLSKMPEPFGEPARIYTSTEAQNLYVLDKGKGKIFVIAKTGEFKIAYSWEEIKQADDLVVIESLKKIFLLSGSKIYEIGMR